MFSTTWPPSSAEEALVLFSNAKGSAISASLCVLLNVVPGAAGEPGNKSCKDLKCFGRIPRLRPGCIVLKKKERKRLYYARDGGGIDPVIPGVVKSAFGLRAIILGSAIRQLPYPQLFFQGEDGVAVDVIELAEPGDCGLILDGDARERVAAHDGVVHGR